jgi:hypothetical protein
VSRDAAGTGSERLHVLAQVAAVAGAIGAVALTLYAGRGNGLPLLMVLMAGWVFAPFFGFALANRFTTAWPPRPRATLDVTMLIIAIVSLAIYARDSLGAAPVRRATPYVAVPLVSWILLVSAFVAGAVMSRHASDR